jgi:hypothetical protein
VRFGKTQSHSVAGFEPSLSSTVSAKNFGSIPQERMDKIDTTLEYGLGLTEI